MPAAHHQSAATRAALPVSIVLLVVLGLAPTRFTRWLGNAAVPVRFAVAPVSAPVRAISNFIHPAESRDTADQRVIALEDEAERLQQALARARNRVDELERLLTEQSVFVENETPVARFVRGVVSTSSDLARPVLTVRLSADDAITTEAVAATTSGQLVGRVSRVAPRTAEVVPITARNHPSVGGEIWLDPDGLIVRACLLEPTSDGLLRGDVEAPPAGSAVEPDAIKPGMSVRLADDTWPAFAQALLLGTVESVEPARDQPLRRVVTVRPRAELHRMAEVVLVTPALPGDHVPSDHSDAQALGGRAP